MKEKYIITNTDYINLLDDLKIASRKRSEEVQDLIGSTESPSLQLAGIKMAKYLVGPIVVNLRPCATKPESYCTLIAHNQKRMKKGISLLNKLTDVDLSAR